MNVFLGALKKGAAHMRPDTLCFLLRWACYNFASRAESEGYQKRGRTV